MRGIKNGDRSYKLEIKPGSNLGSYHLIDGQRVNIRYNGQHQTCARCLETAMNCKGRGVARRCETEGGIKKDFRIYYQIEISKRKGGLMYVTFSA